MLIIGDLKDALKLKPRSRERWEIARLLSTASYLVDNYEPGKTMEMCASTSWFVSEAEQHTYCEQLRAVGFIATIRVDCPPWTGKAQPPRGWIVTLKEIPE